MIKKIIFIGFIWISQHSTIHAQINFWGDLKNPKEIQLSQFTQRKIGTIQIQNHLGQKKNPITQAYGIPFLEVFNQFELNDSLPKNFSRYIFTIVAKDGYTVTFSWNELFNSKIGEGVYFITKTKSHPENGAMLISTKDFYTGRRFVKNVVEIRIERK